MLAVSSQELAGAAYRITVLVDRLYMTQRSSLTTRR
jgi:hypothetical protein